MDAKLFLISNILLQFRGNDNSGAMIIQGNENDGKQIFSKLKIMTNSNSEK